MYTPPAYDEQTISDIHQVILDGGYLEALQDVSTLRRNELVTDQTKLNELFTLALDKMAGEFQQVVKDKNYDEGLRILSSAQVLGEAKNVSSLSQKELMELKLEQLLKENMQSRALLLYKVFMDNGYAGQEDLEQYAAIAVQEQNRSMAELISNNLRKDYGVENQKLNDFLSKRYSPGEMMKGVVTILVNKGLKVEGGVGYPDQVIGSGFFVDKRGYLVTNYHVIESEVDPEYEGFSRLYIRLSDSKNKKIKATVVGYDRIFDIALLKADIEPDYIFSFSEEENVEIGMRILAIGSPVGLENSITSGIVSATGRRFLQMGDALQVDVPINPGNSGGPVLSEDGKLIGVAFAGLENFEGLNFAIPSHWIADILYKLYDEGEVKHPWLGLGVQNGKEGLEIIYVVPGEAAGRAGLKRGDIILSLNDKDYTEIRDMDKELISLDVDSLVKIRWKSGDAVKEGILWMKERPFKPMDVAIKRDSKDHLFVPLFGMAVEETGSVLFSKNYVVLQVYRGFPAEEIGISKDDPFILQAFQVDKKKRFAVLQIFIKKKKAGFIESVIQLIAPLENNFYI